MENPMNTSINSDPADQYKDPRHYDTELVGYSHYELGGLTIAVLKARFYAKFPDGVSSYHDPETLLGFEDTIEERGDYLHEEAWSEWAELGKAGNKAQTEILCALERMRWTDEDWAEYRRRQKLKLEREQVVKTRIKLEAKERTARLAQEKECN
jgi:hypothetical protein